MIPGVDETTVEQWFTASGEREDALRRTDALVVAAAPDLDRQVVPVGGGRMLGYGLMPYRPASAAEVVMWPLIALANQRRHISLYVCAVRDDGQYLTEAYAGRLGSASCGRSCVRFTSLDRVDADGLAALVREAAALTAAGRNAYAG
jgi:hypothetical protein